MPSGTDPAKRAVLLLEAGFREPKGHGSRTVPEPLNQMIGVAAQLFQPGNQNPEMSIEQFHQVANCRVLRADSPQPADLWP